MAVGALWAGIVAVLKVTRGVSEVISSIMLNFIALGLASYLLTGPFRGSAGGRLDRQHRADPRVRLAARASTASSTRWAWPTRRGSSTAS